MKQLDKLHNKRVHQLYAMRAADGWPRGMTKADKQFMTKQGLCDMDGHLRDHVLAHLLKLETAQLPVFDQHRERCELLAVTLDGTACYVRVTNWEGARIKFWLMINFPRCMFGI